MLLEFTLKNFMSFKDEQKFSMVASNKVSEFKENATEIEEHFSVLKTAAIFGANASGKTNLLCGINYLKQLVLDSVKDSQDDQSLPQVAFALNPTTRMAPSSLEIVFVDDDILTRYGVMFDSEKVMSEWLYLDEDEVFTREGQTLTFYDDHYLKPEEMTLKFGMTNERALFLTILSATNTDFAEKILRYFKQNINVIHGLGGSGLQVTKEMLQQNDPAFKERLLLLLSKADFNIIDLEVKKVNMEVTAADGADIPKDLLKELKQKANRLMTKHNVYDDEGQVVATHSFDSEILESSGTREFLKIAGPIIDSLQKGTVLFIDEVDAQLHPNMTKLLLSLFNDQKNRHGQLIVTTHNATNLDNSNLRRDQIWFAEKDKVEATHLTSLANYRFKGEIVRKDERYGKNYLNGKYGAVPLVNDDFAAYDVDLWEE